jgi:DNA-binding response OmpR family regulator
VFFAYNVGMSDGQQGSILIVEDNESIALLTQDIISLHLPDWTISLCKNGKDASSMALSMKPRLVLLDINIPGVRGDELCTLLRSNDLSSSVRILAMSADSSVETKEKILQCGADDFLQKPYTVDMLMNKINTLLSR